MHVSGEEEGTQQGIVVLGTPLGDVAFIQAHLEMKATEQRTLLDRIPLLSDLQSAWLIIALRVGESQLLAQGGRAPGGGRVCQDTRRQHLGLSVPSPQREFGPERGHQKQRQFAIGFGWCWSQECVQDQCFSLLGQLGRLPSNGVCAPPWGRFGNGGTVGGAPRHPIFGGSGSLREVIGRHNGF